MTQNKTGPLPAAARVALTAAAVLLAAGAAFAQSDEKPVIITERNGNITNHRIEGSLAPLQQLGCIELKDVTPAQTPPDFFTAVSSCMGQADYDRAARIFFLASVYSRFDAQRINDKSASGGGQMMIMNTFGKFTPEQRQAFGQAADRLTKTPENFQVWCASVKRIGPPRYFPRYLILHGLAAFTQPTPLANAMVPDFDLETNWARVLETHVRCPA
jgi:hypothetical protein